MALSRGARQHRLELGVGHADEALIGSGWCHRNPPRRSADLAAPEGRVIRREIPILRAEIPLQLNRIARRQRHHGLQPDRGGQRDMGGGDLAEGAPDFRRAVQHQPPAHPGRGAGIDLVKQRRAEEVGTVDGRHEVVVRHVEGPLVIVVGVVQADLVQVPTPT